jgi:ubiquinone/menaquinone biosynthesis C-methylase UbiE
MSHNPISPFRRSAQPPSPQQAVVNYYSSLESRVGYALLLKGRKHLGYYPEGRERLSLLQAQLLMEDLLAQRLALPPGARVLDAGCGEGRVAIHLAQECGLQITGVDLVDWAIKKAQAHAQRARIADRTTFLVTDYTTLGLPDNTFDGVYTMETLVHAQAYREALRQLHRVVKPHGRVALFEYSIAAEGNRPQELEPLGATILERSGLQGLPHFTHGAFPALLAQAGFGMITVEDVTIRVLPMLASFAAYARYPYRVIRLLGLERCWINTVAAAFWEASALQGAWRYNIITAVKLA